MAKKTATKSGKTARKPAKPAKSAAGARKTAAKKAVVKTKPKAKATAVRKAAPGKKAPVGKAVRKSAPPASKAGAGGRTARKPGTPELVRDAVLKVLDDRQAEQIVTIDLRGKSSMADYLIIASGRAARQIAAIADFIRAEMARLKLGKVRVEGEQQGDWVLVDTGDVIVHLFRPEVRRYYNIEQIYGARPYDAA